MSEPVLIAYSPAISTSQSIMPYLLAKGPRTPTPSRLLQLPAELRIAIYKEACTWNNNCADIHTGQKPGHPTRRCTERCPLCQLIALLSTNRQIRNEVFVEVVKKFVLVPTLRTLDRAQSSNGFRPLYTGMPFSLRQHIRRIDVASTFQSSIDVNQTQGNWTSTFPALEHLKVYVDPEDCDLWHQRMRSDDPMDLYMLRLDIQLLCENRGLKSFEFVHPKERCRYCKDAFQTWKLFQKVSARISKLVCQTKGEGKKHLARGFFDD